MAPVVIVVVVVMAAAVTVGVREKGRGQALCRCFVLLFDGSQIEQFILENCTARQLDTIPELIRAGDVHVVVQETDDNPCKSTRANLGADVAMDMTPPRIIVESFSTKKAIISVMTRASQDRGDDQCGLVAMFVVAMQQK